MKTDLFETMRLALRRNVGASRKEALQDFTAELRTKSDAFDVLARAYFETNYARFDVEQTGKGSSVVVPKPVKTFVEREKERAEAKQQISALASQIRTQILLDTILPNGKRLRHSTFADCAKAGGWFAAIAKLGKPSEAVDKKLSEADLQNLWSRYKSNRPGIGHNSRGAA